ncbi:MAG TPA: cytochrome c oxidase subunit 3 [Candidatus Dormibacteraeota bacterium]|nr:cytochrome c oxidase subunit 3 [Candidatus Dormibacteraeota bacterium]
MQEGKNSAALDSAWSGGASPFAMSSKKLGMWLFIVSDSLTFSALLIAYCYSRITNPDWPRPFPMNPAIIFSAGMTVVLLTSSLTMVMAVTASQRNDRKATVLWMIATMACGLAFLGLHAVEWFRLIAEGATFSSNPWGTPLFGAVFFGITGIHMAHVLIGVVYLGIVATGYGRGKFSSEDVEVNGLFWHFVDLVWMFVFPLIYLMSVKY